MNRILVLILAMAVWIAPCFARAQSTPGGGEITIMLPGGVPLELVRIPAGTFLMGSPPDERGRNSDEGPQTTVTISEDFYMGKYEVTVGQFLSYLNATGNETGVDFDDSDCPVARSGDEYVLSKNDFGQSLSQPMVEVSWYGAQAFCSWVSDVSGRTVGLPTEAQWEYACRAGTTTRFSFGDSLSVGDRCEDDGLRSQHMVYCGNGPGHTAEVGSKLPNPWGLYDMHGNTNEWCQDWYAPSLPGGSVTDPTGPTARIPPWFPVYRGGDWSRAAGGCRSAKRDSYLPFPPRDPKYNIGFRVSSVRNPTVTPTPSPPPDPVGLVDVLLGRGPAEQSMDENADGILDAADLVPGGGGEITIMLPGGVPLELVRIPAGTFVMGSPPDERSRNPDEGPQTTVALTEDFYMGKYEVTVGQFLAYLNATGNETGVEFSSPHCPVARSGDDYVLSGNEFGQSRSQPMVVVSWHGAQAFCAWVSDVSGRTVGLPTEAQWEYACRAGTSTRFSFGDSLSVRDGCEDDGLRSQHMVYCQPFPGSTKEVGSKLPNPWGLFDMHGNTYEWCEDWYISSLPGGLVVDPTGPTSTSLRVRRGGSSGSFASACRSALRTASPPSSTLDYIGFRVSSSR